MSLRITDKDQLKRMTPWARKQLSAELDINDIIASDEGVRVLERPRRSGRVGRPEEEDGKALVTWMDALVLGNGLRPGLFFFHVPNGMARTATMGGIFKAQGLRKGWPDYGLMLPLGGYHGFWLEIKSEFGAKPSKEQLDILARLESVGYKCGVSWGFDDSQKQLQQYLDFAR